jgi:CRISPR/Cas system-associated endonuclease/helicase Cas3
VNDAARRSVRVELRALADHPAALASAALCAARAGARVLVLRNSVASAVATQEALEQQCLPSERPLLFCVRGLPTLHHGHFAREDRIALDQALATRLGMRASQRQGCVVVAADSAEPRDDLDADFMLTDLAPMAVLRRRLGAVHRQRERDPFRVPGFRPASAVVLLRDEPIDVELGLGDDGDSSGEQPASRRGERVGMIRFEVPGIRGPFGAELRELELPGGLADGIPRAPLLEPSDVEVEPSELGNAVRFSVGGARFVYDRWGLRGVG